jgi:predicted RNase H-like nuclease (RuvC/YqgF family)
VSQIEHLQTIFKKVVSTDGVKEEDFSLEAGYTKLEVIRYQAYIKAVRGKTQAIEDVKEALSKLITNWSVFYSKQQDTLNLLVQAFREEKVRARRDRIFKDCQEVVKNLFEKLEETGTDLDELMNKFNALRSATIEIPYAVYVIFNDLKYIEQYITELAQNKRLLKEVKEAMGELNLHKDRYEQYFGKVEEYHKFREFFIDSVCYDFNRCSKILANRILSEKGVN